MHWKLPPWDPPLWKRKKDIPWWADYFLPPAILLIAGLLTLGAIFLLPFYLFGCAVYNTATRFLPSSEAMKTKFYACLLVLAAAMTRGRADCIVNNNPAVLNPYDPATENCTTTNPGQNVTLCSLESSLRLDGYGCPCTFAGPCAFSPGQVPLADNPRFLWIDADGDGQGARGSAPVRRCTTGSGYVDNDWDCDDTNAAIFRGVAVCRSRHPSSLATVYPDLNITSSPFTTISAACSPIATVQRWGTSVSVHGTVMAMSSPCRNVLVVFNWDDVAKQWVYLSSVQLYPCSGSFCAGGPILGSPSYGRSLSTWDPFIMVSSGTDNSTDGLVVGFDIYTHVGPVWSRICCVASQTTIRQDSTNAATSGLMYRLPTRALLPATRAMQEATALPSWVRLSATPTFPSICAVAREHPVQLPGRHSGEPPTYAVPRGLDWVNSVLLIVPMGVKPCLPTSIAISISLTLPVRYASENTHVFFVHQPTNRVSSGITLDRM